MSVRTRRIFIVAVLAVAATISGVVYSFATPSLSYPIYLEPAGSPRHEDSERRVCAAWLPIERTGPSSWTQEWWIVLPKKSSLYTELTSSKSLQFEIDVGSGLDDVCVSE